ncbi:type I-E CRISPR-associated protein Cas7/Cse4/CasC [Streptomyces natalensis]|uniref:CRISPR-associated protein Cse4 n=1 Tax=Streptomyces natalensis ATCC 27448 TaxID=1240678 RepID=A0A0D7CIN9_9ACTN|nr:type I-E CRISPR-associated protein Cas7/Cse4/CasC [Streptomyces natalensis]KIZ15700.1 hypothetical protein SNA_25565 [Streptomyces natalensis ATCC 27448]
MTFLCLHALTTVPFSNMNRDENGEPKKVLYGGATRERWSSQAQSRPLRLHIEEATGIQALRTRRIPQQLTNRLTARDWPNDLAASAAEQTMTSAGLGVDRNGNTVLAFISASAIDQLADLCDTHRQAIEQHANDNTGKKSKKGSATGIPATDVQKILTSSNGSIGLFGRMLAELPDAGVDAARQMAHGFTTHAVPNVPMSDFFTAVDDLQGDSETGSGHMNHAYYASGTFYRYAVLDLDSLLNNLDSDTETARILVTAFTDGFIRTLPQAKKNTTAPATAPDLVHLTVRTDQPLNYSPAFERPITDHNRSGWAEPSRQALAHYAQRLTTLIGDPDTGASPWSGYATIAADDYPGLGARATSYPALTKTATEELFDAHNKTAKRP